jgi:cytidylate kinase
MAPHNLGLLIDRQMRRWALQHPVAIAESPSPCVALARLRGSGGVEIGRRVAEWLDYGFFDKEIVDWIAREEGIQRQLVEGLDERVRSGIDRYVADAFQSHPFTESDYLRDLVRIVVTLGNRGMAVIAGHGAPFILPPERALRVLVTAPMSERVRRYAAAEGLDPAAAGARLAEEDAERREFYRAQFGVDQGDPLLYDLVVNTGTLSVEAGARLVVEALRSRFPPADEAGAAR